MAEPTSLSGAPLAAGVGLRSVFLLAVVPAIVVLVLLAFAYYRASTQSQNLAAIGLLSFAAVAQFAPAIVSGQRRMMRVVDVPIGQSGVAGYAIDVQDLEEARAELDLFVRAQRDMLDRLTAGVVQFGADQGLVFYNRHFLRLFELSPEWLADRPEFDRVLERMRETQRAPESRDFRTWRADRRQWFAATSMRLMTSTCT